MPLALEMEAFARAARAMDVIVIFEKVLR